MTADRDLILTGVPRSGTTLACLLLSQLPDVVALNEPMRTAGFDGPAAALRAIPAFYADTRRSILQRGVATARAVNGKMTDNHFARVKGNRVKLVEKQEIRIGKKLSKDFRLACKHNALFTILLNDLQRVYPVFAIVRNPLAALASWNSVGIPAGRGEVRAMNRLLPETARELKGAGDVYDRQLFILDWYFRQYRTLPEERVLRYEEIVRSGGAALAAIDPAARSLDEDLSSRNRSPVYDWEALQPLAERLLASDNACWTFYDKSAVEALLPS